MSKIVVSNLTALRHLVELDRDEHHQVTGGFVFPSFSLQISNTKINVDSTLNSAVVLEPGSSNNVVQLYYPTSIQVGS
ncbi:hypothetical protein IFO70_30325 [Phormidium tenue FACHB-886]|nr:hypothetical protein [Phormidium tenue FACHB-886]